MKAIVLEEPGKVVLKEVAEPETGSDDEVMLAVRYIGLCGSDLNSYRGKNPLLSFPRILGHEVSAVVAETNPKHPEWRAGTQVTLSPYNHCGVCASCRRQRYNACKNNLTMGVMRDGAMCERIYMPASKLFAANLSLKELCLVEPLTVGFHSSARGNVAPGETVAVIGCGGVGLGAVAGAAHRGARVIAIDVDDRKLSTAKKAGAVEAIHSGRENVHERLAELTDGLGPDVVIEAIGLPDTYRMAVEEVAFTGRVVYIGYAKEPVSYETKYFVQKELDIRGSRNALPEDFREVMKYLEAGTFPVDDAVTHIVPMEQVPVILEQWSREPVKFSKIMVEVSR
ncbi:MAG: zinc-binding alcohol dehydrogenase family protein [Acidobacteriota bacterium]|nr:zinc-binding alcohol dehydrogenase family protein [Acidobacteriota bacterium]